jgi:hypothetical protein
MIVDTKKIDISHKISNTKINRIIISTNDPWMQKNIHPGNFKCHAFQLDTTFVCAA